MTGRVGRRSTDLAPAAVALTPVQRLASILWSLQIAPTPPFGSDWPVVCFTQTTRRALSHLTRGPPRRYDGTGLAFHVQPVFDAGGGPALYLRGDEIDDWQYSSPPAPMKARAVRYWPGSVPTTANEVLGLTHVESQWLHEREWRIPRPATAPPGWWWTFNASDVTFLLLRDGEQHAHLFATLDGWRAQEPARDTSWIRGLPVAFMEGDGAWSLPAHVPGWP